MFRDILDLEEKKKERENKIKSFLTSQLILSFSLKKPSVASAAGGICTGGKKFTWCELIHTAQQKQQRQRQQQRRASIHISFAEISSPCQVYTFKRLEIICFFPKTAAASRTPHSTLKTLNTFVLPMTDSPVYQAIIAPTPPLSFFC